MPATNHFPRARRNTFTRRLLDAALDLEERLDEANRRKDRTSIERLERADEALDHVRIYLRLAFPFGWLTNGQYRHVAPMTPEIGRAGSGYRIRPSA